MKNTLGMLLLCAALGAPLPALAQPPGRLSYTYLDGRLVSYDFDGPGSADGIRLGGSYQFDPNLFGVGSFTSVSDSGFDYTQLDLGVGYRNPLSTRTDLVGIVGLVLAEIDVGPFDDNDTGISLTGGVRSLLAPQFEVGGYVSYAEVFGDGDIELIGEGLLHLTPQLALAASLGVSDDVDIVTLGARWNFPAGRR